MANPKGKHGKSRTRKRRATWKLAALNLVPCPQCHQPKQPHRACEECGYYAGREVITVEKE
ncbi:MAG: 50S ribosomal protein L32 [Firmicutes bacterium]|nr:50S ribosomal protein L32 [Bacillota bacterium]